MTAFDVRSRAQAARMLAPIAQGGKGQEITLTHVTPGTYDPSTGTVSTTTTTQTTSGAVFEYTTFLRSGLRTEAGSLIQAGDKQLLLSPFDADGLPLSPAPQVDDTVTLADGRVWTITTLAPLSPAGTPVYFDCNIRGA